MARQDSIRREASRILQKTRGNARRRGIGLFVTAADVEGLLRVQQMRCAVSGVHFDNSPREDGGRVRPFIASLDRIDAKLPYTRENVRVVCAAVNAALGDWGDGVLERIVQGISHKRGWAMQPPERALPRWVVCRLKTGRPVYEVVMHWDHKKWYFGCFDTADEASAYAQFIRGQLMRGTPVETLIKPNSKQAKAHHESSREPVLGGMAA